VRGAAADAGASSGPGAGEGDPEADPVITADMLDEFVDELAGRAVELQLWLHSYALKKGWLGAKIKAASVPDEAKVRAVGKRLWKRCFQRLATRFMPDLELPDYIVAPIMIATMGLPLQLGEGAELIRDDEKGTAPGAQPAPGPAAG
jgi:hypothetical protein